MVFTLAIIRNVSKKIILKTFFDSSILCTSSKLKKTKMQRYRLLFEMSIPYRYPICIFMYFSYLNISSMFCNFYIQNLQCFCHEKSERRFFVNILFLLRMFAFISSGINNLFQYYFSAKPSLKIGTVNAICWNYLGGYRDNGLDNIFV